MVIEFKVGSSKFWITIEPITKIDGTHLGFAAFWNRFEPGLILGEAVRENNKIVTFDSAKDAEDRAKQVITKRVLE